MSSNLHRRNSPCVSLAVGSITFLFIYQPNLLVKLVSDAGSQSHTGQGLSSLLGSTVAQVVGLFSCSKKVLGFNPNLASFCTV